MEGSLREWLGLPPHRNEEVAPVDRPTPRDVSRETYLHSASIGVSPDPAPPSTMVGGMEEPTAPNVSRETLGGGVSLHLAESGDTVGDMATTTNNDRWGDLFAQFVQHVVAQVTDRLEDVVEGAVERALNEYDPTDHDNFTYEVERIATDAVDDRLSNASWSITYEG